MNQKLINSIKDICNIGASSTSDDFQDTVFNKFKKDIQFDRCITHETWKETSLYKEHRKLANKYIFDFSKLSAIVDNGQTIKTILIKNPNGSQKWPDLLVVKNNIGLPIEIKSAKDDKIVWNGGLPRKNSIYIFNCHGKMRTICFLGQHAITDKERLELKLTSLQSSMNNKECGSWSFFSRAMYNDTKHYLGNLDKATQMMNDTFEFIQNLSWTPSQHTNFID